MSSLRDRIDPAPAAIGVLLLATLVLQFALPGADLQAPVHVAQPRPLTPVAVTPAPVVTQALARPLFSPGRSAAEGGGIGEAAASLGDYVFVGTTFTRQAGTAIVRTSTGNMRSLHAGEALLGWTVTAIHPSELVLERQAERLNVTVNSPLAPKTADR